MQYRTGELPVFVGEFGLKQELSGRQVRKNTRYLYIMECREAIESDVSALPGIRGKDPAAKENWTRRISGYMNRTKNPRHALLPRVIYVTEDQGSIVGFIAGHLTQRFGCEGELEWIDVIPEFRNQGIAATLLQHLAARFIDRRRFKSVSIAPRITWLLRISIKKWR